MKVRKSTPLTDSIPARMLCLRIIWELEKRRHSINKTEYHRDYEKKFKEFRSFNSGGEKAIKVI